MIKEQLQQRLIELRAEYESGQKMLAALEDKQVNLRETLLRITGAIQVLEEELSKAAQVNSSNGAAAEEEPAEVVEQSTPAVVPQFLVDDPESPAEPLLTRPEQRTVQPD